MTRLIRYSCILLISTLPALSRAHGSAHKAESPWHKLEFWNGEFHLFAMIFWLAIAVAVGGIIIKLVKRAAGQGDNKKGDL